MSPQRPHPPHGRTRIKFCGMVRPGDVRLAGELGVDAVGFVFAPGSPRRLQPEEAARLRAALAPLVDAVALFMDNSAAEVRATIRQLRPTLLQFHGGEDDAFCRRFGLPYLKAIPMGGARAPSAAALRARYPGAAGFVLDGHAPGAAGGSGDAFDWRRWPRGLSRPALLAGGLNADNVYAAIAAAQPWGVDVSSGIERAPGVKDAARMRRFVAEVRRADCRRQAPAP
ncbi:phosphoribosylanthranilate isomerase [Cognatiluteimonas weifangensis]